MRGRITPTAVSGTCLWATPSSWRKSSESGQSSSETAEVSQDENESHNSTDESDDPSESTAVFDLENGTVLLNSGYTMPILGIGCFTLTDEEAENSVYWALKAGFRLIDTARIYGNEEGVGRGIQRAIDEGDLQAGGHLRYHKNVDVRLWRWRKRH